MSLVFKVAKLREAAESAVKLHEAARTQYDHDVAAYRLQYREDWKLNHMEGVGRLRDYLSRCIKSNTVPEHSTARKALGKSDLKLYSQPSPGGTTVPQPPGYHNPRIGTIRAMVSFLDAYEGDTITAAQLKVVGFDDLASLYREAVGS